MRKVLLCCGVAVFMAVIILALPAPPAAAPMFVAVKPWPVKYSCITSGNDTELEQRVCSELMRALAMTEAVRYKYPNRGPYFHFIVLPTERDGCVSLIIASNFVHPAFAGLEISSFYSNYHLVAGGVDQEGVFDFIAGRAVLGTAEWFEWAKMRILSVWSDKPRPVEA